jgi:hypothetical protein
MQQNTAMAALRDSVQELYDEMSRHKQIGSKDLQRYLERKDALIGAGDHHRKRQVTRGQIMGDLRDWLDDPHHN